MAEGDVRLRVRSGDLGDHLGAARHVHGRDGLGLRDPRAATRTPSAAVLRRRRRQRAGGDRRRQTAQGPRATTNARSSARRSSSCRSPCRSASSPTPITSTPAPASTGSARSARSSRSPSSSPRPSSPTGDDRNAHPTSDDDHPSAPHRGARLRQHGRRARRSPPAAGGARRVGFLVQSSPHFTSHPPHREGTHQCQISNSYSPSSQMSSPPTTPRWR